jgi:hypothetical protein
MLCLWLVRTTIPVVWETGVTRDYQVLVHRAKEVLEGNWMGSATKPAPKLYPHQWSWDSAFVAIGYSHFNQKRAQQELVSLFQGQWNNGMLPHIIFNPEAADYKPGPEFWQTDRSSAASRKPLTSGIIQPPNTRHCRTTHLRPWTGSTRGPTLRRGAVSQAEALA